MRRFQRVKLLSFFWGFLCLHLQIWVIRKSECLTKTRVQCIPLFWDKKQANQSKEVDTLLIYGNKHWRFKQPVKSQRVLQFIWKRKLVCLNSSQSDGGLCLLSPFLLWRYGREFEPKCWPSPSHVLGFHLDSKKEFCGTNKEYLDIECWSNAGKQQV